MAKDAINIRDTDKMLTHFPNLKKTKLPATTTPTPYVNVDAMAAPKRPYLGINTKFAPKAIGNRITIKQREIDGLPLALITPVNDVKTAMSDIPKIRTLKGEDAGANASE